MHHLVFSINRDVKLLEQKTGKNNLVNLVRDLSKNVESLSADLSRHNASLWSKFQGEIQSLQSKIDLIHKEKSDTKPLLDELMALVRRLDKDIENLRASSAQGTEPTTKVTTELKNQFEAFRADFQGIAQRLEHLEHLPFLGNMSAHLTGMKLGMLKLQSLSPNGADDNGTNVKLLGGEIEKLQRTLGSLTSDMAQIRSNSNVSVDFVRLNEKYDKMFVDTMAAIARIVEQIQQLESKVTSSKLKKI